ncbi:MAG: hypothetical protein BroJett041_03350 [Candidatus Jettenia caeni]|nr:MAG: hypothetical protein BroJett041_03350 [Candidatus Jettenia caeni]GJQ45766.1 MAG: hypothetical protein JETCAE04_15200 [Candidatus Jettenia caeni]
MRLQNLTGKRTPGKTFKEMEFLFFTLYRYFLPRSSLGKFNPPIAGDAERIKLPKKSFSECTLCRTSYRAWNILFA